MTTITETAASNSDFSILVAILGKIASETGTDYAAILNTEAPTEDQIFTVFAPVNAAFGNLAVDLGFAGDPADVDAVEAFILGLDVGLLETVIRYHVSAGAQTAADIVDAGSVTTLDGLVIDGTETPVLGDLEPDLLDPSLLATDIIAVNGVVHVIDRVLLPVDLPGNDVPSVTGTVLAVSGDSGFDENAADFDILREAVVTADLAGLLDSDAVDVTVFAPTDAAFVALSQTLGYAGSDEAGAFGYLVDALRLLNGGENPVDLLTTVLQYHVAGQSLQASQVLAAAEIPTLAGADITVDAGALTLGDLDPDLPDPGLVATDILASNGIIHAIDGVLLPADLLKSDGSNDVDFVIGNDKREFIITGRDNDLIDGKGGRDVILAGRGDDLVLGGNGGDRIIGGKGDDTLKGENGRDFIAGGSGDDIIVGGQGHDVMIGGAGNDTFVFSHNDGEDTILFFRAGHDKIDLSAYDFDGFEDIEDHIDGWFFSTSIDLGDTEINLLGTSRFSIGAEDFIF